MEETPKKKRTYKRTKYPNACPNIRETKQRKANAIKKEEKIKEAKKEKETERKSEWGKELSRRFSKLPKKFPTPQILADALEDYFDNTPIEEWTLTGVALSLGTSRQVLGQYEEREDYKELIVRARTLVEHSYELGLKANGKAGDIFALKNFGWRDDRSFTMSGADGGAIKHEWKIEVVDPTTKETILIEQDKLIEEEK